MYKALMSTRLNVNTKHLSCYEVSIFPVGEDAKETTYQDGPVYKNIRYDVAVRKTLNEVLAWAMDQIGLPCKFILTFNTIGEAEHIYLKPFDWKPEKGKPVTYKTLASRFPNGTSFSSDGEEYI